MNELVRFLEEKLGLNQTEVNQLCDLMQAEDFDKELFNKHLEIIENSLREAGVDTLDLLGIFILFQKAILTSVFEKVRKRALLAEVREYTERFMGEE
jgi:hypothetical protein